MTYSQKLPASFYHLLVFLFLFIPYVQVGGLVLHLPYFYLFFLAILFVVIFAARGVAKGYFYVLALFLIPYLWVLFVSAWNGVLDVNMQINFLNAYLVIFGAFGLSLLVAKRFGAESGGFLVRAIYFSGVAHAVIMVAAFFVAPVREILYSFVILGTKGQEFVENLYRSPGLTTGGGDALSVMQATALVFGLYYFTAIKKSVRPLAFLAYTGSFILLFISILLSARTGLVILLLGIFMLGIRHLYLMLNSGLVSKANFVKFCFLFIVFSISVPLLYFFIMNSEYSRFARRAFELFINFFEYGKVGTSSTDHLMTMYFFPEFGMQYIFGDGNFGRDASLGIIQSDVGYVRIWFGGGIMGVIFFYAPIIMLWLHYSSKAAQTALFFPLLFTIFTLLLVNFKVYHLYSSYFGFKILLLLLAVLIASRVKENP